MSKQKKFYLLLLSTFLGLFCLNLRSNVVVARSSFTMGILENDKPYSYKNDQNWQGFSIELAHQLEEVGYRPRRRAHRKEIQRSRQPPARFSSLRSACLDARHDGHRSEEHTSELQSR